MFSHNQPSFVDGIDWVLFSVTLLRSVHYENLLFFQDKVTKTRPPNIVKLWLLWAITASSHSTFVWITSAPSTHCVTQTRDWEEFTHFVYSFCQVNVNVKVSVFVGMGEIVIFRSMTCLLEPKGGENVFDSWLKSFGQNMTDKIAKILVLRLFLLKKCDPCFDSKQLLADLPHNPCWQFTSEGFRDFKGD